MCCEHRTGTGRTRYRQPTRKQIYLPKESNSADENDDDGRSEAWMEMCGDWEFEDVEGEPSEGMSFSRLLSDIQRE